MRRPPGTFWPVVALWLALGAGLTAITSRVADWFVMTDELLYERLAISIVQTHSPLPRLHEELLPSLSQLYPLLIAPLFAGGYVSDDLHRVHILNAWLMSSACIPAFLLARRVVGRLWPSYLVAFLTVCMPWILYSSFLLTEVVAYPVFLWVVLASQAAVASPSARNDALALMALAIAFFARGQFVVLLAVPPAAIAACELARARGPGRVGRALRRSLEGHRVLAAAYAALAAAALVLAAAGHVTKVFGVYREAIGGNLVPGGTFEAMLEHVATLSLGLAILPVVVALAWLLANVVTPPERQEARVFAWIGVLAFVLLVLEVTTYDLRFGGSYVRDRYLFYLVPIVLIASACAVCDARPLRRALLAPAALVAAGFALNAPPEFTWSRLSQLDTDTPATSLYEPLVRLTGSQGASRVLLAVTTIALTALYVLGSRLARRALPAAFAAFVVVGMTATTFFVYDRLFGIDGWSSRPLTSGAGSAYTWVDRAVGRNPAVAMVPYPVSTDPFVNGRVWRDYEFWNKSVVRAVQYPEPGHFEFTGNTFTKLYPTFDERTGAASISPTRFALFSVQESRFRLAGTAIVVESGVTLIDAVRPWRLDWRSSGLYPDGWTKPGRLATIRVYAQPGQDGARSRALSLAVRPPPDVATRRFDVSSNLGRWRGVAEGTTRVIVHVCVPAIGFAEVRLGTPERSPIPGDLSNTAAGMIARSGGVFVAEIALADEIGEQCRPPQRRRPV